MQLHSLLLHSLALLLLAELTASQTDVPTPNCSCTGFCNHSCSFLRHGKRGYPTDSGRPQNVTLYRLTPRGIGGLTNKNSGDAFGDEFFGVRGVALPMICRTQPYYQGCFLNLPDNVYVAYTVEVDGRWGVYQECNPMDGNLSQYSCEPDFSVPAECSQCARTQKAVGRAGILHRYDAVPPPEYVWDSWRIWLSHIVQGFWLSHPSGGECAAGHVAGDSSNCTWRIVGTQRVVNASCVSRRVEEEVESHVGNCTRNCSQPLNRSGDCYTRCFFGGIFGNLTGENGPMAREQLLAPWLAAFATEDPSSGGCPTVPLL